MIFCQISQVLQSTFICMLILAQMHTHTHTPDRQRESGDKMCINMLPRAAKVGVTDLLDAISNAWRVGNSYTAVPIVAGYGPEATVSFAGE